MALASHTLTETSFFLHTVLFILSDILFSGLQINQFNKELQKD